jgi:hypothetical protein
MKTIKLISALAFIFASLQLNAQSKTSYKSNTQKTVTNNGIPGSYGNTLNLGIGLGYSGSANNTLPIIQLNYEFTAARNFTIAPFIGFYNYRKDNYWGNNNTPYRNYYYQETVMPIGVKGSYYFDDILSANSKWDFYLAGSLGFAFVKRSWENGYYGDKNYYRNASAMYFDLHLGTEFHINRKVGLFLDLSTGVTSIGLAFHN